MLELIGWIVQYKTMDGEVHELEPLPYDRALEERERLKAEKALSVKMFKYLWAT